MKQRLKVLDFWRGIAILLVMLRHTTLSPVTTQMGWIGVDLFFVLSGFLVSGLLFSEYLKNGTVSPLRFLIRRGLKIYPLFYSTLLLHVLYYYIKNTPVSISEVLPEIFFYQNYETGIIGISWSLAIEEHFYLLLSIGLFIFFKKKIIEKQAAVPAACLFIAVLCLLLRIATWQVYPEFNPYQHFFPTHLRIDSLTFGVLIAWVYYFRFHWLCLVINRFKYPILAASVLLLLPSFFFTAECKEMNIWGFTCLYIGFGFLVSVSLVKAGSIKEKVSHFRLHSIFNGLAWIGVYSYSIYLLHMKAGPILSNFIASKVPGISSSIILLFSLTFNIICGYLLSIAIEKPFLRLREKYFPAR